MSIQVLVASMNQDDHSLLKSMNITSDAIIANQTSFNSIEDVEYNNHKVTYLNFNEKGVGLNRNNALMRATNEIVVFADDDEEFVINYQQIIEKAFKENPKADVLIFNIEGLPSGNSSKVKRIRFHNVMKYGAVRIAAKREALAEKGIFFNLSFGGGCKYSHGEDSIFLVDCLRKGLKIFTYPACIARMLDTRPSTWFNGYNDKYFSDTGKMYKVITRRFWVLLCIQDAISHSRLYGQSWRYVFKEMIRK